MIDARMIAPPPAPAVAGQVTRWLTRRAWRLALPAAVAAGGFVVPPPSGLTDTAWRMFGVFAATILAIMVQAMPEASAVFVGVAVAGAAVVPLKDVLVGYTDQTLWLIITAMMMAVAFRKSGLARRTGLWLIRTFGRSSLGIAYVLGVLEVGLATTVPAAPARTGGLVYPLARGVLDVVGSHPAQGRRRLGSYLVVYLYMVSMVAGSMFLTGMAPNLLNVKLAEKILHVQVTWPMWAMAAAPGVLLLVLLPPLLLRLDPPELRQMEGVREQARQDLAALGPMHWHEILVALTFLLALGLWATSARTGINASVVAFVGAAILLVCNCIEWKDLAESKELWSALMWFGGIIGLSAALDSTGFFKWFIGALKGSLPLGTLSPLTTYLLLAVLATVPHYFFPSLVGYVSTFSPVLFAFIGATGAPPYPAVFLTCFLMVISSALTHYGNGLGPILFDSGYVQKGTWWRIGLVVTALGAAIYLVVGLPYWKLVGLYR